jgi:hypothetical protein
MRALGADPIRLQSEQSGDTMKVRTRLVNIMPFACLMGLERRALSTADTAVQLEEY